MEREPGGGDRATVRLDHQLGHLSRAPNKSHFSDSFLLKVCFMFHTDLFWANITP